MERELDSPPSDDHGIASRILFCLPRQRENFCRQAERGSDRKKNIEGKLGWEPIDSKKQSKPSMSQLGSLRTAIANPTTSDPKANVLERWVVGMNKKKSQVDKWPGSLDRLERLAQKRDLVWEWLGIKDQDLPGSHPAPPSLHALKLGERGTTLPELVRTHQRLTQISVKLYRWLRAHFFSPRPLIELLPALIESYATL